MEGKRLIIAGYQTDGRMLAVAIPEIYQADKIGVLDIRETLEEDFSAFSEVRLFWLTLAANFPVPEKLFEEIIMEQ